MLRIGDLVKYHKRSHLLDTLGFEVGQFYEVKPWKEDQSGLFIFSDSEYPVSLVDSKGELTDHTYNFTLVRSMKLSRGRRWDN